MPAQVCNALAHVVRCFSDPNVIHVDGSVDPIRDISIIDYELILADLDSVVKKYNALEKAARTGNKVAAAQFGVIQRVRAALEEAKPVRSLGLSEDELALIKE